MRGHEVWRALREYLSSSGPGKFHFPHRSSGSRIISPRHEGNSVCITRVTALSGECLRLGHRIVISSVTMSSVTDQERLKSLFEAKVKSFESKAPQRFQTLHPFKEGIAELRSKRASFRTIADLLNQLGVAVSHNTVARFCTEILVGASPRRQSRPRSAKPLDVRAAVKQQREEQVTSPSPIPSPNHGRGPRIADPRNV